ncbi:MAG: transposase [Xenococcus sp. (in: cyanobacteria)]
MGLAVWTEDEAGPYGTHPYETQTWQQQGEPLKQPHEYLPNGTAKILTLFHPADGQVLLKGVESVTNKVLHPWLKEQLSQILDGLPPHRATICEEDNRQLWETWRQGLKVKFTLPQELPPLRLLLICDNLKGHKTPDLVVWFCDHGILPLYTPLSGSWLNMTESIQKILKQRALGGQNPSQPQQIIDNFETIAQVWNQHPTPFEWGGKRAKRRQEARLRKLHPIAASGACTRYPIRQHLSLLETWLCS